MQPNLIAPGGPKLAITDIPSIWTFPAEFEWLIDKAIAVGSVNLLSAESGTGKSWVAYDIAGSVALGRPFAGKPVQRRPVLCLDGENPVQTVKERLKLLGIGENDGLKVWGGWLDEAPPGPNDPRIIQWAKEQKGLLIWDSLVEFHPGDEMNASETRAFMKNFRALAHVGATVLILHHCGKAAGAQDYRGSSDIKAAVDTAYKLESLEERDGKLYRLQVVTFKSRSTPPQKFGLEYHPGQGFAGFTAHLAMPKMDATAMIREILEESGQLNGTEIKEKAREKYGASKNAIDTALSRWPNQAKGKGNTKIYHRQSLPRAA